MELIFSFSNSPSPDGLKVYHHLDQWLTRSLTVPTELTSVWVTHSLTKLPKPTKTHWLNCTVCNNSHSLTHSITSSTQWRLSLPSFVILVMFWVYISIAMFDLLFSCCSLQIHRIFSTLQFKVRVKVESSESDFKKLAAGLQAELACSVLGGFCEPPSSPRLNYVKEERPPPLKRFIHHHQAQQHTLSPSHWTIYNGVAQM